MRRDPKAGAYMIGVVATRYEIHPQTLRIYEREGLLTPSRTEGKTRLFSEEDLERLEVILNLTRDMGVNLAGVEVILNLRDRMQKMQEEMQEIIEAYEAKLRAAGIDPGAGFGKVSPTGLVKITAKGLLKKSK
ncbi:MAG: helix-turn-helix transcriptional regulator [Acidobacteria bacterium]|nr:helix-turn-helix transcriptional regulator [Acidobacteriota bacterium]